MPLNHGWSFAIEEHSCGSVNVKFTAPGSLNKRTKLFPRGSFKESFESAFAHRLLTLARMSAIHRAYRNAPDAINAASARHEQEEATSTVDGEHIPSFSSYYMRLSPRLG